MGKPDALSRRSDHGSGADDNQDMVLLKPDLFIIRALEGVTSLGEEKNLLREIRELVKSGQIEESVGKVVEELRKSGVKSLRSEEWSEEDGLLCFRGRVYVPNDPELRRRIVAQHHDTHVAGHPGRWKTHELVSRNYWWPQMSRYIGTYTSTCDLCLRTKIRRQSPLGELHPIPVPEVRWETISVDFIVELPMAHGYDAIMCVVDSLSKRAHFIPTNTTLTSLGTARLFLHNSWKLHGLPRSVISDRGPQFVSEFTRELYRLLGIQLSATTAYHPQADGQTERVNQELEQYLRLFVSERQDDWDELLPMAEFQYNNHIHSATQETPFLLDTGMHPRMGFEPRQVPSKREAVNEFVARMNNSLTEAKAALNKSKDDMAQYYNRRRTPPPILQPGDRVYIDASDIRTTRPSSKLAHRYLGPYKVEAKVGRNTYRLQLPGAMKALHPVFNIVKLLPAPEDPIPGRNAELPPPPTLVDERGDEHYEVEKILDSRLIRNKLHFLVKWKGYGYEDNQWLAEADLNTPDLLREFYQRHPGAPRRLENTQFQSLTRRNQRRRDAASKRGG
jgi:transposase InsO family protein